MVRGLVAEPVVVPGFMFDLVASVPALPSLDAPVAGCICADAIAVAPNHAATTRAETASLHRMATSLDCDATTTTSHEDLGSGGRHISGAQAAGRRLAGLYRKTQYHPRIKSEGVPLSNTRFVEGCIRANRYYLLLLNLSVLLPFCAPEFIPVVVPDFILLDFILSDFIF